MKKGDYVLATRWSDGHPSEPWCVGFLDQTKTVSGSLRYYIVDSNGELFRANGFRRAEKISSKRGEILVKFIKLIEQSAHSVWYYARLPYKDFAELEAILLSFR